MFVDVVLRTRDTSRAAYDVQGFGVSVKPNNVKLYAKDGSRGLYDVQLRPANRWLPTVVIDGGFPTQYSGLKVEKTGSTIELCLVATADDSTGMGGSVRVYKGGTVYALYLVETADGNASPVRVQTSTGTKAIRLKT